MGELELASLRSILHHIKKIVCSDVDDPELLLNACPANVISRVSEFFSILPEEGREDELTDWLVLFDDAEVILDLMKSLNVFGLNPMIKMKSYSSFQFGCGGIYLGFYL